MKASRISRRSFLLIGAAGVATASTVGSANSWKVPVLAYHRFGPVVADSMTIRTATFTEQLGQIQDQQFEVTPLSDVVQQLRMPDLRHSEGSKVVAITADDGHQSVYGVMWPIVKRLSLPITLFIYPSAISNASYALTWAELREMHASGLVSIGSHSYWHPNFHVEKKRLTPDAYNRFVDFQLVRSKQVLEDKLGAAVSLFAWPFGIYDDDLVRAAEKAGYAAAFTIDRRPATTRDNRMLLPRFLMTDTDKGARFERSILCD